MNPLLSSKALPCLSIALGDVVESRLRAAFPAISLTSLPYDLDKLLSPVEVAPLFIICGLGPEGASVQELAQMLRMNYRSTPIYLVVDGESRVDRKAIIKNGMSDVFFLPLDFELLCRSVKESIASIDSKQKAFRAVKLVDLHADTTLDFDTYLYMPANNKHIRYSAAGDPIDEARLSRLKKFQTSALYVSAGEIKKVYEYTASVLKKIGSSELLSETERCQKLHTAVRELVSSLFSDAATGIDGSKALVEDCQSIVRSYLGQISKEGWYEKILNLSGGATGSTSHAANVSAYSALFGIALGNAHVEEIAVAGLLHDVGLAKVPAEAQEKPLLQMTQLERHAYERHPEFSIDLIRERKIVIPELSHKIIMQHHECYNGSGFPKGLRGNRISEEAQILSFADRFDDLLRAIPGQPSRTPMQAARELASLAVDDPGKAFIAPELMKRLIDLFPAEAILGEQAEEVA